MAKASFQYDVVQYEGLVQYDTHAHTTEVYLCLASQIKMPKSKKDYWICVYHIHAP